MQGGFRRPVAVAEFVFEGEEERGQIRQVCGVDFQHFVPLLIPDGEQAALRTVIQIPVIQLLKGAITPTVQTDMQAFGQYIYAFAPDVERGQRHDDQREQQAWVNQMQTDASRDHQAAEQISAGQPTTPLTDNGRLWVSGDG